MLLSPRSFRTKVNGSFYPPSSSGVGTPPTRPDKPSPRRTLRSDTPEHRPFSASGDVTAAPNGSTLTYFGGSDRSTRKRLRQRPAGSGERGGAGGQQGRDHHDRCPGD